MLLVVNWYNYPYNRCLEGGKMFIKRTRLLDNEYMRLVEDEIQGKEVKLLATMHGDYLTKEQVLELIEELKEVYENNEVEAVIDSRNKANKLYQAGFHFGTTGRYIRGNSPVYKFKEFNRKTKTNRIRKMTCDFCGKKFTSETQDGYYKFSDYFLSHQGISNCNEQACSEPCIRHIWDELLNEWLKREGFKEFIQ